MRNRLSSFIWGLAFIIAGVGFAGNVFHLWDFRLFFDGWWTLFIIVPCAFSLFQGGFHTAPAIGLVAGVLLLLAQQDVIDDGLVWKLLVPVIFVLIGMRIILRGAFRKRFEPCRGAIQANGNGYACLIAVFCARKERLAGDFQGAAVTAVFGGVDLDLRDTVITHDVTISVTAVFGGADIYLPPNVRVRLDSLPILGGIENQYREPAGGPADLPVVYIDAVCAFGGVDIK